MSSEIQLGDLSGSCQWDVETDDVVVNLRCPDLVLLCRECGTNCKRPVLLFEHCKTEHGRQPTREERTPVSTDADSDFQYARPHARGEQCGNVKLTAQDVRSMRAAVARGGQTKQEIAVAHGVTPSCLSNILSGRTWSHVV
jgi:hypothetical protein